MYLFIFSSFFSFFFCSYFLIFYALFHVFFFFCFSYFYAFNETPLRKTGCFSNSQLLLAAQASSHLIHLLSLTQSVRPHLVPYQSLCIMFMICRMSCCSIGHQISPSQPLPNEAEDFPRGRKYPKDVPLPTHLDYLSPKSISWQLLFMCKCVLKMINGWLTLHHIMSLFSFFYGLSQSI